MSCKILSAFTMLPPKWGEHCCVCNCVECRASDTSSLPCSALCATIDACHASVAGSCNCRWHFRNANYCCRSIKWNCCSRCSGLMGTAAIPVNSISARTTQSLSIYCPDRFPAKDEIRTLHIYTHIYCTLYTYIKISNK